MKVKHLVKSDIPAWDEYVATHSDSTFYHRVEWKEVMEKSFGHKTYYLMAMDGDSVAGILPLIHREEVFALKGGTAINFFIRELPRLSVDIDLTYLPINERETALYDISHALIRVSKEIKRRIPRTKIALKNIDGSNITRDMIAFQGGVTVKIEPNLVLRGSVYPPEVRTLSKRARDLFELSLKSRILSMAELYAGKICAALDHQHPRDLLISTFWSEAKDWPRIHEEHLSCILSATHGL